MIRSLWISKTGLDAQQTNMDVISNNLANVSTNGFKRARAMFDRPNQDVSYRRLIHALLEKFGEVRFLRAEVDGSVSHRVQVGLHGMSGNVAVDTATDLVRRDGQEIARTGVDRALNELFEKLVLA